MNSFEKIREKNVEAPMIKLDQCFLGKEVVTEENKTGFGFVGAMLEKTIQTDG